MPKKLILFHFEKFIFILEQSIHFEYTNPICFFLILYIRTILKKERAVFESNTALQLCSFVFLIISSVPIQPGSDLTP